MVNEGTHLCQLSSKVFTTLERYLNNAVWMVRLIIVLYILLVLNFKLIAQTSLVIPTSHKIDLSNPELPSFNKNKLTKEQRKAKRTARKLARQESRSLVEQYLPIDTSILDTKLPTIDTSDVVALIPVNLDTSVIRQTITEYKNQWPDTLDYETFKSHLPEDKVQELESWEKYPYYEEYEWLKEQNSLLQSTRDSIKSDDFQPDSLLYATINQKLESEGQKLLARSEYNELESQLGTDFKESLYQDLYPVDLKSTSEFDAFEPLDYQRYLEQIRGIPAVKEHEQIFADKKKLLKSAMAKQERLKTKSGVQEAFKEVVNQRTDEIKEKSFTERSGLGGYVQFRSGEPSIIDIAPNYYYALTGKLSAGVGLSYRFYLGEMEQPPQRTDQAKPLSYRAYLEYLLFWSLYLHAEYERNDYTVSRDFEATDFPAFSNEHYVGLGRDLQIREGFKSSFLVLYNLTQDNHSPNPNRFVIRVGFKI